MKKSEFTQNERKLFNYETNQFLADRSWERRELEGETIYVKKRADYPPTNFLDKPKKTTLPSIEETIRSINHFFSKRGYTLGVESDISLKDNYDTFLMGAGIQYFRRCFWGSDIPGEGRFFIPQPVVRVKYADRIKEGVTSSFVNPTTAQLLGSFQDHLASLDDWFDLFSEIGLYMGDFNLRIVSPERYGQGKKGNWASTDGFSMSINYLNLNIGDAGYIRVPTNKNGILEVSDIGFGLERILWALYKTPSYFDLIGPEIERKYSRFTLMDSMRSATLLGMSNINNATQDAYNQFRKFTKTASHEYGLFDTFRLVKHYYGFWSKFITPRKDLLGTYYFLDEKISEENENGQEIL